MKIAPSVLNAPIENIKEWIVALEDAYMIHLDIMDGHFVPNLSFGIDIAKTFKRLSNIPLDVHLMTTHPLQWIDQFKSLQPQFITIHVEAKDVEKSIKTIKKEDIGVGLAVKPNTPIEIILPYLNEVDLVLIMTVEPGFGGQSFMPNMLKKVKQLQSYKKQHPFIIQVDGGINDDHIQLCQEAGVDVAVVGSYLFKQQDMKTWLKKNQ
jgi:ribulose-phosphate 3-epimerase